MVTIEKRGEHFVLKTDNFETKEYDYIEKQINGYVGMIRHADGGNSYDVYDVNGNELLKLIEESGYLIENYNISLKNNKVITVHYQRTSGRFNEPVYDEDTILYFTYKGRGINRYLDNLEYPESYPKYHIVKMNNETNDITFSDGKVEKVFNLDTFNVVSTNICEQDLTL